ncbi:MAG: amidohydrolase family protein [Candidatus Rokubacteria bacterium]|nr:amidohydrolase family protein [Candidatus Rokubacteria bacterium]
MGQADLVDLGVRDGRIVALGDLATPPAPRVLPVAGRVVVPGFVDAHVHLDKALLLDRAPSREGTLAEAIRVTAEAKRRFTVEDIRARARAVLDLAVGHGTTAMRSHVEVDPLVGLKGVEALLPLRAEYADRLDLQLCAFAQEGILQAPGTEDLLREALRAGVDLVGGCPYNDTDGPAHVDRVFALAREFGTDVDFHLDFSDEPEHLHVRDVAEKTIGEGWQGRVAVGHLTELAACDEAEQARLIGLIREAGIAVITLPATDLYLTGRRDGRNVRRGLTPVKRLLAAGVPVAAATNNVRNAFTPVGNADPLLLAYLLAVAAHMGADAEMAAALDMVTVAPARILGHRDHGIEVGSRADLVVLEARSLAEAVGALPARRWVLKAGRLTVDRSRARPGASP